MTYDEWLRVFGFNPWHANQLAWRKVPVTSDCPSVTFEYAWQGVDRAGRAEIRDAIEEAERQIHEYTSVWPTARYVEQDYPHARGRSTLFEAMPVKMGLRITEDLGEKTVTLEDMDSDGIKETAVVTIDAPVNGDVRLRFMEADLGAAPNRDLRPYSVEGTKIKLHAYSIVRPTRVEGPTPVAMDPDANGVLATSLRVLVDSYDAQKAATVHYTDGSTRDFPVVISHGEGRAAYRLDYGDCFDFQGDCRLPMKVTVRGVFGVTDGSWDRVVARLAAANMARPICACSAANRELFNWQFDLSTVGASDVLYQTPADAENPFGSRRGQVHAWRFVQDNAVKTGFIAG